MPPQELLIGVSAAALFVGMGVGVMLLVRKLSGWARLAAVYAYPGVLTGQRFRCQSLALRWQCSYNGCVTLVSDAEGLGIRLWFPFNIGHPQLLIPWADLTRMDQSNNSFIPHHGEEWRAAAVPDIPLRLWRKTAAQLCAAIGEPAAHLLPPG